MRVFSSLLLTFFLSSEVLAQTPASPALTEAQLVEGVLRKMNAVLLQCPARIWPSLSQWKTNVLFVSTKQGAVLWDHTTGKTEAVSEREISPGLRFGSYSFQQFRGVDTVSVFTGDTAFNTVDSLYDLIAHEGFHFIGQRGWRREQTGGRATFYPTSAGPRVYRRLLFDRLKTFVISGGQDKLALSQAAYWNQLWESAYPEEKKSTTDQYEGTARYFDVVSSALGRVGCESSEEQLFEAVKKNVESRLGHSVSGNRMELSSEGYDIGGLSTLALRFIGKKSDWHLQIQNGKTPLDVLFSGVTPAAEPMNVNLKSLFEFNALAVNKSIGALLDNDLALLKLNDIVFIGFSYDSLKASYTTYGHYVPVDFPEITMIPLVDDLTFEGAGWRATVRKTKVVMSVERNPCPVPGFVVALKAGAVQGLGSNKILTSDPLFTASLTGTSAQGSRGRSWFCAQ